MALDLVARMKLDDKEFKASLASSRTQADVFGERLGEMLKVKTKAVTEVVGAINSIGAVFSAVTGWIGLAVGAAVALGAAFNSAAEKTKQLRQEAEEASKRSREASQSASEFLDAQARDRAGGFLNGLDSKAVGDLKQISDLVQKIAEAQSALKSGSVEYYKNQSDLNKLMRERQRIESESKVREIVEENKRIREAELFGQRMEMDLMKEQGRLREAAMIDEDLAHQERLRRIKELAKGDYEYYESLAELAEDQHRAALDRIEREEAKRKQAADEEKRRQEEAAARERQRLEDLKFSFALDEQSLDAENARLAGDEKRAKLLELEIDHKRRLREIEQSEGATSAEKQRLAEKENRNFRQRLAAAERESITRAGAGGVRSDPRTVGPGLVFDNRTLERALGNTQSQDRKREKREEDQKKAIEEVRDIMRRMNGGGVLLDGAARALGVN